MDSSTQNTLADNFEAEKSILNEFATKIPSENFNLPILKFSPKEPGIFDWYQKFIDWLRGKASEGTEALGIYDLLGMIGRFLEKNWIWVSGLLIILAIAYFIYRSAKALKQKVTSPEAQIFINSSQKEIYDWIQKSLLEKNFLLAARLRWILFLRDQKSPNYLTPKEYTRKNSLQILNIGMVLQLIYRSMFDPTANTPQDYQNFETQVKSFHETL